MTTETTQLPPCPLEGCEAVEHHWHSLIAQHDMLAVVEACKSTGDGASRCYGPHRPGLSEPIDLPEITDEMVDRAVVTYVNTYYAYDDAGSRRAAMRAALTEFRADLIAGTPQWQPIEHDQIRAGMRIRATFHRGDCTTAHVGVAHHQAVGCWYTEERWPLAHWGDPSIYEVDPSTILADPDAELIEKIALAIRDSDESTDEWGEDPSSEAYRKQARVALDAVRESEVEA